MAMAIALVVLATAVALGRILYFTAQSPNERLGYLFPPGRADASNVLLNLAVVFCVLIAAYRLGAHLASPWNGMLAFGPPILTATAGTLLHNRRCKQEAT